MDVNNRNLENSTVSPKLTHEILSKAADLLRGYNVQPPYYTIAYSDNIEGNLESVSMVIFTDPEGSVIEPHIWGVYEIPITKVDGKPEW